MRHPMSLTIPYDSHDFPSGVRRRKSAARTALWTFWRRSWIRGMRSTGAWSAGTGGPFDPIGFDEARARFGMENIARRRRDPLASHRNGSRRPKR